MQQVEFFDGTTSLGVVSKHFPIFDSVLDPSRPEIDPIWGPFNIVHFIWSNAPPGAHVLTAVATDNRGAATASAPSNIRIFEMPSQPVVTVNATDPEASEGNPDPTGAAAPLFLGRTQRRQQ